MKDTRRTILKFGATALVGRPLTAGAGSLPDAPFRTGKGWQPLLNGRDLSGWHSELGWHGVAGRLNEWFTTTAVSWSDDRPNTLTATPAPGGIFANGVETHTTNLIADRNFGDVELYVEFMVSKDSNSGVYLHGLYEVQILDSYGKAGSLKYGDGGGIYEQVDNNNKGFGGTPPRLNACRPPGEWQFYHVYFRAPRFDAAAKKVGNARFERVIYNGQLIHEAVAAGGPTRSALDIPEAPRNPIMLQGDHGPVAFRNIYFRALS